MRQNVSFYTKRFSSTFRYRIFKRRLILMKILFFFPVLKHSQTCSGIKNTTEVFSFPVTFAGEFIQQILRYVLTVLLIRI